MRRCFALSFDRCRRSAEIDRPLWSAAISRALNLPLLLCFTSVFPDLRQHRHQAVFRSGTASILLEHARRNNEKAGVTGMLLYKDGNFMQVLEGEERVVQALSAKIGRDPRHEKMVTLLEGPLAEREFSDWSMGF